MSVQVGTCVKRRYPTTTYTRLHLCDSAQVAIVGLRIRMPLMALNVAHNINNDVVGIRGTGGERSFRSLRYLVKWRRADRVRLEHPEGALAIA